MNSCLQVSRPTPNFCDSVPSRLEFTESVRWQMDECKRHGLAPERQCGQLFQQVQQYCERAARKVVTGGGFAMPDKDKTGEDSDTPAPPPPVARPRAK